MIMDKVVEISTIKPEWDDVVVVKVKWDKMPPHIRQQYGERLLESLKETFPKNKVVVIGSDIEIKLDKINS